MTEGFYQWTTSALLPKVWRGGEVPWAPSSRDTSEGWADLQRHHSCHQEGPTAPSHSPQDEEGGAPRPSRGFFFFSFSLFLKKAPLGAFSLTASLPCLVKDDERHRLNGISANYNNNNKKIICASLLHLQDLYTKCRVHRAHGIIKFCTHPFNGMFTLMQSGERYRSMGRGTARLLKSFFPAAIRLPHQRRLRRAFLFVFLVRF